ncbi:hypothetical protein OCV99_03610 [Dorea acetigenes]|uniref:Uncharacterized protein n=1 Tax=Dorea acetigenes TaxID=2981787 RepID=A0ABT2RJQ8_9FIRM|nr:hypothetical protein [Dorea acetigenes]MCU6685652.1 hypothetical protein [Dorea acetigenes]SCI58508.1 Uncharacterised protein [uncultured Clostridium sp.]
MRNEKMLHAAYIRLQEENKALRKENAELRESQEILEAAIIENYEETVTNSDAIMELYEAMA